MTKRLLEEISSSTRLVLAKSRGLALRGQLSDAIKELDQKRDQLLNSISVPSANSQIEVECVVLSLLKAELLHLNLEDEKASVIFESEILNKITFLSSEIELIVMQNYGAVEIALLNPTMGKQLNRSYDEREMLGAKYWDPEAIVYAYEFAASGKHYESLPAFWGELITTYEHASWFSHRQAARRMAIESMQLGFVDLAVYHALIAEDVELISKIGEQLLLLRDHERIQLAVQKLLNTAHLGRHAHIASIFFGIIWDAIPEEYFASIFEWLLARATFVPKNWNEHSLSQAVWQTLFQMTRRQTAQQAKAVVSTAANHPFWDEPNRLRGELLRTVNASVPHLSPEELNELATQSLHAATTKQEQIDFGDALNLLCHLAERSEEAKKTIGDTLYQSGQFENFELRQLGPLFGREMLAQDVEEEASKISDDIRRQVQRFKKGETSPRPMMILASLSGHDDFGEVVVHVYVFTPLDSLLEHRKSLSASAVGRIVSALLETINEQENIPANKIGSIGRIIQLADLLTPELAENVFENLAPFAEGNRLILPKLMQSMGSPTDPLNPFKLNFQTAEEVQAAALFALASIEEKHPGIYRARLAKLLEIGMAHSDPKVRHSAISGLKNINVLGDVLIGSLIIGTRDPDASVAAVAYRVLAINEHLKFSDPYWLSFAHSVSLGVNSPSSRVRRDTAFAIAKREPQWTGTLIAERMNQLKARIQNDICWSVRQTILKSQLPVGDEQS
jgi:hypothetical protein